MNKRLIAMLLAAVLLMVCAVPAMAAAPKVKKIEFEGNGVVEVEFTSKNVKYKNPKIAVTDAEANFLSAKIVKKDGDDLTFKVSGLKSGTKYGFAISGLRAGKSGKFDIVNGSFKPPSGPAIKKVTYDKADKELDIEFATKVQFKGLNVVVKDTDGKALTVKKIKKGDDDLELKVSGVKKGQKYVVIVNGVRVGGLGDYVSASKTFKA